MGLQFSVAIVAQGIDMNRENFDAIGSAQLAHLEYRDRKWSFATDGHVCLIVQDDNPQTPLRKGPINHLSVTDDITDYVNPVDHPIDLLELKKFCGPASRYERCDFCGGEGETTCNHCGETKFCQPCDGGGYKWSHGLGERLVVLTYDVFNANLLALALECFEISSGDATARIKFYNLGGNALRIDGSLQGVPFIIILMACANEPDGLPVFEIKEETNAI